MLAFGLFAIISQIIQTNGLPSGQRLRRLPLLHFLPRRNRRLTAHRPRALLPGAVAALLDLGSLAVGLGVQEERVG